jgi:hypothetical protein
MNHADTKNTPDYVGTSFTLQAPNMDFPSYVSPNNDDIQMGSMTTSDDGTTWHIDTIHINAYTFPLGVSWPALCIDECLRLLRANSLPI